MTNHRRGKNEGSISKRLNGRWRAQISQSGDRISKGFRTKNEALTWIQLVKMKMDQGISIRGENITLSDYLPSWLEEKRSSLRPKTTHQYASLISHHILPSMGHIKLCQLNIKMVERYNSDLLQNGVGVRTIRIINNILHSSLDKAVKYEFISKNPTQGATLPVYRFDEMQVFSVEQISCFLNSAKTSSRFAFYYLALVTGMRMGELLGLKWADIDWINGTISVRRQRQYVPGEGCSLIEPKTRAGKRTILIGEKAKEILRIHKVTQTEFKSNYSKKWTESDLVFPNSVGKPGDASNIRLDFNRILDLGGLPKIRFHDLRHTAASLLLNHNIPVIIVSNILGHSKPSVTLDLYGHVLCDMQQEAAATMDKLIQTIDNH